MTRITHAMVKQVQHCAHHFDGQHPESSCISLRTRALIILVCSLATGMHTTLWLIFKRVLWNPLFYIQEHPRVWGNNRIWDCPAVLLDCPAVPKCHHLVNPRTKFPPIFQFALRCAGLAARRAPALRASRRGWSWRQEGSTWLDQTARAPSVL